MSHNLHDITYRWLDGDECVDWLNDTIQAHGWAPLNSQTARALCAFKAERIVGFACLQLFPHCEPLYVDPEYRGSGLSEDLADHMYDFMRKVRARGYMVICESPFAEKLCRDRGMKRVQHPVYMAVQEA